MTEHEAAALAALKEYARATGAYNALIDHSTLDFRSTEYMDAANAMEAANDAALAAVEPLLDD